MPNRKRPAEISIGITSTEDGHTVEWTKNGEPGSLGPYQSLETAEKVREAKERELRENP